MVECCVGSGSTRCVGGHPGASYVVEGNLAAHFDREACIEGTDLFMNVHEKGVRAPASHLSNGDGAGPIEEECHGAAGAERVAADILWSVPPGVESVLPSCPFEQGADLVSLDMLPESEHGGADIEDFGAVGATVGHDVVHTPGQCFDGTVLVVVGILCDALAFVAVLLVGHADCGLICLVELSEGCGGCDWDEPALPAKRDVFYREGHCVGTAVSWSGVLPHPEEVEECNGGKVHLGLSQWVWALGVVEAAVPLLKLLDDCHRKGQLWLGPWIVSGVSSYLLLESQPVPLGAWLEAGIVPLFQLKGLADGAKRVLN